MSAFMVDKTHIDALLTAGLTSRYGLTWYWQTPDGATQVGRLATQEPGQVGAMLLATNQESVNVRYEEEEIEEPYLFEALPFTPDPVIVLKAIACYEYQACEHQTWKGSEAEAFCDALRHETISQLPGYEDAPWEFTAADVARLRHTR